MNPQLPQMYSFLERKYNAALQQMAQMMDALLSKDADIGQLHQQLAQMTAENNRLKEKYEPEQANGDAEAVNDDFPTNDEILGKPASQ